MLTPRRRYLTGAGVLLGLYAVLTAALWVARDFSAEGPLSPSAAPSELPLPGRPRALVLGDCFDELDPDYRYEAVGGEVDGEPYAACYERRPDGGVFRAVVVDRDGREVRDQAVLKAAGVWPWLGIVKTPGELVGGGAALIAILGAGWLCYRRPRPAPPTSPRWYQRQGLHSVLLAVPIVGWIVLRLLPGVSGARRRRLAFQGLFGWCGLVVALVLLLSTGVSDPWGYTVGGLLAGGLAYGVVAGRLWLAPPGFDTPDTPVGTAPPTSAPPTSAPPTSAPPTSAPPTSTFRTVGPERLPSFADVGGMDGLKAELADTFGLMLAFSGEADAYRITWNGVLLHGPPGVGKTFVAKAAAGEFGMHFIPVSTAEVASAFRGESSRNIEAAFRYAATQVPCVLFFDEFDAVATSREDVGDQESRRTVTQLLQSLERYREVRDLVVVAATNDLDQLDEAVVRPGRFDRHVRVDLPDAAGRRAILAVQLAGRPHSDVDLDRLAAATDGMTPAALAQCVERAALTAFRETTATGGLVTLSTQHLLTSLRQHGGQDRPTLEEWTWDALVLDERTKRELRQVEAMVEDPDRARAFGIAPPSGLLLAGPPGTGKTTIAKVLAAQTRCSFYPVSGADVTSKWLGESERAIRRLFRRARENRPSIIFLDELDAIAGRRGAWGTHDRQVNALLQEMDGVRGQQGVFVVGATNRPDQLDPALLRGGRLSRTVMIPLPDRTGRRALLDRLTAGMPLRDVDLDGLADGTEGRSGADLRALCEQAALHAMVRDDDAAAASVTGDDFTAASRTLESPDARVRS